jgi:hypothetical protein
MKTEALRDGILKSIDTFKESNFYADFKYIRFIKLIHINQKFLLKITIAVNYKNNKLFCLIFDKRKNTPLKVRES